VTRGLPSRQGSTPRREDADTERAMDAAPAQDLHGRGVPRLLRHFDALERMTGDADGPTGRARLEHELGCDLAQLLVCALVRPPARASFSPA
jgi:hypothetical protein